MPRVYASLSHWARLATTFAGLRLTFLERNETGAAGADGLIYRLKHWPRLPQAMRTADVLRALSMMSNRPVNRRWIIANSRMDAGQVDRLLRRLVDQGAVGVVDCSKFAAPGGAD